MAQPSAPPAEPSAAPRCYYCTKSVTVTPLICCDARVTTTWGLMAYCNRALCPEHAVQVRPNLTYCPEHVPPSREGVARGRRRQ